jgi:hypothetical protein
VKAVTNSAQTNIGKPQRNPVGYKATKDMLKAAIPTPEEIARNIALEKLTSLTRPEARLTKAASPDCSAIKTESRTSRYLTLSKISVWKYDQKLLI